jgi:hypothetical protein
MHMHVCILDSRIILNTYRKLYNLILPGTAYRPVNGVHCRWEGTLWRDTICLFGAIDVCTHIRKPLVQYLLRPSRPWMDLIINGIHVVSEQHKSEADWIHFSPSSSAIAHKCTSYWMYSIGCCIWKWISLTLRRYAKCNCKRFIRLTFNAR